MKTVPELLDAEPTVTYKDDAKPITRSEMSADSFIVTTDKDKHLFIQDRNAFKSFYDETVAFNKSAQIQEQRYRSQFKVPAYPHNFLVFLARNNWVYRQCADRVANDCIKNGFDIVSKNGIEDESDIDAKNELLNFFNRMPEAITDTIQKTVYTLETSGHSGIEIIREYGLDSPLQHFLNFDITDVKLLEDGKRIIQNINGEDTFFILYGTNYKNGEKQYLNRFTGKWSDTSFGKDVDAHEVLWFYRYDLGCNEYGIPSIASGIAIIETELGRQNYVIDFFVNFGMPAWIVSISGTFYDEENNKYLPDGSLNPHFDVTKTLRYKIGQQIQEIRDGGRHGAIVMSFPTSSGQDPVKVEITPLATDTKEASFRGLREDNAKDICSMMGVDPNLILGSETGPMGNNAVDSLLAQHNDNKVKPTQNKIMSKINKLLLFENETTFVNDISNMKFKLLDFIEQNITENVLRDKELVLSGLMTAREFQNKYSKALGITSNSNEELLDEYCINGVPLSVIAGNGMTDDDLRTIEYNVVKAGAEFERKHRNILQAKKYANKGPLSAIKEAIRR